MMKSRKESINIPYRLKLISLRRFSKGAVHDCFGALLLSVYSVWVGMNAKN
jgi:hypothetical protein